MNLVILPYKSQNDTNLIERAFASSVIYSSAIDNMEKASLLYLPGGGDVDPKRYGGDSSLCYGIYPHLDIWEDLAIQTALKHDVPIFGVCRGCQTLWVSLGGKLQEEIFPEHSKYFKDSYHPIKGLWKNFIVNSLHHQAAVGEPPIGVTVTCWSLDDVIEAFTYKHNVVGVQWHPEMMMFSWENLLKHIISGTIEEFTFEEIL